MTPYELRFEIFKQAQTLAEFRYHADMGIIERRKEFDSCNSDDYPTYPTFEYIQKIAEDINAFVSKN